MFQYGAVVPHMFLRLAQLLRLPRLCVIALLWVPKGTHRFQRVRVLKQWLERRNQLPVQAPEELQQRLDDIRRCKALYHIETKYGR